MALSILQMVLPVLLMIALGYMCKRYGWFDEGGLKGIKAVVGKITLPVVLFNAFFTADYSAATLLTFAAVFLSLGAALAIGFLCRRLNPKYGKFMPFLMTGFEGGMLGYALFGLLYGAGQTHVFAMADIGQTVFAYTVFLSVLNVVNGDKPSVKGVAKNMLSNPACVGMLLGIVLGALGLGKAVAASAVGPLVTEVISFITAPTSVLILLIVGYELSFNRAIMKPVLTTVALRFAVMCALCCVCALVIFAIVPFNKQLLVALMLGFTLPAPFIIPLYADVTGHGEYISTTLSISTLLSVLAFIGIAAFTLA
ncbi:MAG: AEC family transporter [Clostridiales bacterium]|nr:AEC family transporter [Clostridiales bacterium]